jgi:hypothetical protein
MAKIEAVSLAQIVQHEVEQYAGNTHDATLYAVSDTIQKIYTVICVPENEAEGPTWVMLMVRVLDDKVIVDEDTAVDKPFYQSLVKNANIPQERIVLAYQNE